MPASGARSGTAPSRSERGAGDGRVGLTYTLACGHTTPRREPVARATSLERSLWQCPQGCGLQRRERP